MLVCSPQRSVSSLPYENTVYGEVWLTIAYLKNGNILMNFCFVIADLMYTGRLPAGVEHK